MLDVSFVSRLGASRTRSFCPENPHGEAGRAAMAEVGSASRAARDLGRGWKVDPYVDIAPGATHELANLDEPGCVRHLWATTDRPHSVSYTHLRAHETRHDLVCRLLL